MHNVLVDGDGELRCWNCGSRSFTEKRTFRAKAIGVAAAPLVGGISLVAPLGTKKKLKCKACGKYNDVGSADPLPTAPDSGRSLDELRRAIGSEVESLTAMDLRGPDWVAEISGEEFRLTRKRPLSPTSEDVFALGEIVSSVFKPSRLGNQGWVTLVTKAAPIPVKGTLKIVSDPNSFSFTQSQQGMCERLHGFFLLIAELNGVVEQGLGDSGRPPSSPSTSASATPAKRIATLKTLHAEGLISDAQFAAKQQEILDEI